MNNSKVIGKAGKFQIGFRPEELSSHSGLVLIKELAEKLGIKEILDREISVKERARGYSESEAMLGLIYSQILGGSCLSDLKVLRGDNGSLKLLGVSSIIAPTTAGEYLRKFDIGDIKDFIRANRLIQQQAHAVAPLPASCTIDLDSSIYEQASKRKQGSNMAYNGEIGYHPLFAFWAETSELLHSHLRRGSAYTASKTVYFLKETLKRVPSNCQRKLRADSGFYSLEIVNFCQSQQITFAISADQTAPLMNLILSLPESSWQDIEKYGVSQAAELRYTPYRWPREYRFVAKRELAQHKDGSLYFRCHVVITNNEILSPVDIILWYAEHANMENLIKEHKSGFSLEHLPTQSFHANWAYLLTGQLAFNLIAWLKRIVLPPSYHNVTIKTIRHHILNLAGKIVHSARQSFLFISHHYQFQDVWQFALNKLAVLNCAA